MTNSTRPTFLTVLCILSFIGCGLAVLGSFATITKLTGILGLVAALVCLYGVIQMWKLKKMGFWIYLVGEIAPIIITAVTVGVAGLFTFAGGFTAIMIGLGSIFTIAFIIMYALNLKHMH
jgi:hypothetical protein